MATASSSAGDLLTGQASGRYRRREPTGGRVTGLRSESDDLGVAAFVDLQTADGEETTYELFLENEDPAAYIFRPASN